MATKFRRVQVWDLPLRLFHWTLVIAIAVAFLSSEEDSPIGQWHVLAGWIAGILIVFRLVWGFVGGEHSRFADFIRPLRIVDHISALAKGRAAPSLGHNPLGAVAVVILLTLTGLTVWTGAFGGEAAEDLHEVIAWTLLGMVGVHILAVALMSVLERENLVRAMIGGSKPAERHPGARDATAPRASALLLACAVVAGAIYGVLRYDPQAFTLRSPQAVERNEGTVQGKTPAPIDDD
jgi:cytochrome b